MRRGLPRNVGVPVAALTLVALAVFFGGGSAYAPLVWIGGGAVLAAGVVAGLAGFGRLAVARLDGVGWTFFVLLGAFVVWNAVTIVWSYTPDRSWEYFNRGVVYFAFAVLGVFAARVRLVAWSLLGVFSAALLWALAGKVVPDLYPDGERIARLRAPLEYWNALALLAAMTMVLALWAAARREHRWELRVGATVALFAGAVALLLTYSRGGAVVALLALAVAVWLASDRLDAIVALVVSLPPAALLSAWAFTQPGLVDDGQSYDRRLADGLQFGVGLVLVGGVVAGLAYLGLRHEDRWGRES